MDIYLECGLKKYSGVARCVIWVHGCPNIDPYQTKMCIYIYIYIVYTCIYIYSIYIYSILYIYTVYTVKNKVRMRFWFRVMVARLAPPHGRRILTEGTPVNMYIYIYVHSILYIRAA